MSAPEQRGPAARPAAARPASAGPAPGRPATAGSTPAHPAAANPAAAHPAPAGSAPGQPAPANLALAKRVASWLGSEPPLPPALGTWRPAGDRAYYLGRTPARLGVGRAGTRCRTGTVLDALADHAAARDAVASALEPEVLRRHGVALLRSAAADRGEFLRRPDLGRRLSAEAAEKVRRHGLRAPQVQIVAADGLSATAINVNLPLVLPPLAAELGRGGVRLGTPFAISLGRVVCADEVARLTEAEVLCLLVGERPGLRTAQSMGAYITYMKVKQFNEAMRVVISNIHEGGLPPAEAAQQIAQTCRQALAEKRTGVEA